MKKVLSIMLIAMMILAIAIPVSANSANSSLGSIPKTETVPSTDGVKDDVYNEGLYLSVKNPHPSVPDSVGGGGADAWLLWDDNYLYVFMEVKVLSFYNPDDYKDQQISSQWSLTTVEVLLDFTNESDNGNDVCQFRLDDSGYPNCTLGNSNSCIYGTDCDEYFEYGSVKTGNSYTVEYKIDYNKVKALGESQDVTFGSEWGSGKEIGMLLFSQEVNEDGSQALFVSNVSDGAGNWAPATYDYVVLGDIVVGKIAVEFESNVTADTTAPVNTTNESAPATVPQTGDSGLIVLFVLAVSCAGVIILAKKKTI